MPEQKYTIDDLFTGGIPQAFDVPNFSGSTPSFQNAFYEVPNVSAIGIALTGTSTTQTNSNNAFVGINCGIKNTSGYNNSSFGFESMRFNVSGRDNAAVGYRSMYFCTSGNLNTAIGDSALAGLLTGQSNTAVGANSLFAATGTENTSVGVSALEITSGSRNVALGSYAGKYETGSDALYVDNRDRTNTAGDKANAILYGVMAASAANQYLTVNARLNVSQSHTPSSASDTGTAGEIAWDANYIYVCTATNTWKRAGLSTW